MKKITCLVLLLSFALSATADARDYRFFRLRVPSPPVEGSAEYDRDFAILHQFQDTRTPEDCAYAANQSHLTLENGFGPETGILTASEVRRARLLSLRVMIQVGITVLYFKQRIHRPRPFRVDDSLIPCISQPGNHDWSYPSGHSTTGYALALMLARKFPHKRDIILKQGLQIGENRLIGGVHHPSDVEAGRALAEQMFGSPQLDPKIQMLLELEESSAEILE